MGFWFFGTKRGNLHKKVEELDKVLKNSFSRVREDMGHLGNWVVNFRENQKHHENKLNDIIERLEKIENFILNIKPNIEFEEKEALRIERVQSFNRSDQSFMNVQSIEKLTPAQKQVVALLVYAGGPMGYEDISKKLKLNVVTIRRHINDIERIGFKINKKVSVKNRRKIFYLDKNVRDKLSRGVEIRKKKEGI